VSRSFEGILLLPLYYEIESDIVGSGTNSISGMVKTPHQTATDRKDNFIASEASAIPNQWGFKYISTLTKK